jgi:hypothetical protein
MAPYAAIRAGGALGVACLASAAAGLHLGTEPACSSWHAAAWWGSVPPRAATTIARSRRRNAGFAVLQPQDPTEQAN